VELRNVVYIDGKGANAVHSLRSLCYKATAHAQPSAQQAIHKSAFPSVQHAPLSHIKLQQQFSKSPRAVIWLWPIHALMIPGKTSCSVVEVVLVLSMFVTAGGANIGNISSSAMTVIVDDENLQERTAFIAANSVLCR